MRGFPNWERKRTREAQEETSRRHLGEGRGQAHQQRGDSTSSRPPAALKGESLHRLGGRQCGGLLGSGDDRGDLGDRLGILHVDNRDVELQWCVRESR